MPLFVCTKLGKPVAKPGFGASASEAAVVPMPPATVHKDSLFMSRHYDIRASREVASMESITIPAAMNKPSHYHLRRCILFSDP
jgi:hypothetical protein